LEGNYCIFNGHLVSVYEPFLAINNRAFKYGDSIFETIRVCNNKLMFLKDHITRLKLGMTALRMNVPAEFSVENIQALMIQLLKKNVHAPNSRIRLTVLRNEGGFYTPETNDISFLIESNQLETNYQLNAKGLWVDVFGDIKKPINKLSNIKHGSALLYVLAGVAKQSMKLDECFIINELGNICESISSNVFVVKNGTLYTPPLSEGCLDGVMRKQIISLAAQNKILVFENRLTVYIICNADEVFLTNSVAGIQWVGQYKQSYFTNKMATFFMEKLNQLSN
jgi:branched-chain amino acid aminotransferase